MRGDAEQGCIRLILRNLDAKDRGPIHPAEGLEIAAVIENRYVLADVKCSGFRHRCIRHFLGQLRRDTVFLYHVSHWIPSSTWYLLRVDRFRTSCIPDGLPLSCRINLAEIRNVTSRALVQAIIPPSTLRLAPVMYEDSGPATNATNAATSSTCP